MRIAALTDFHAVSDTFARALSDARQEGFDVLLLMGDLLTYGVAPLETLALVHDAVARDGAILLAGNHDMLYRAQNKAGDAYLAGLPDWLREAVSWTSAQLPSGAMDSFAWRESWSAGPLFAAHANPYDFGDWRYIRSPDDAQAAADVLARRDFRYGLFGHTHRSRRFDCANATIFTLGSLGQPRDDKDRRMQWAMVDVTHELVTVTPRAVPFDRDAHLKSIRTSSLSPPTQDRLCGYFA